jgi:hypothetical protein
VPALNETRAFETFAIKWEEIMSETRRSLLGRIGVIFIGAIALFSPQNLYAFFRRRRRRHNDAGPCRTSFQFTGTGHSHVHLIKRDGKHADFNLYIETPVSGGSISSSDLANNGVKGEVGEQATIAAWLYSSLPAGYMKAADTYVQPSNSPYCWAAGFLSVSPGAYCLVVQATADDGSIVGATVNFTVS